MSLAYNGLPFSVPNNIYIIGMMNTADRSLARMLISICQLILEGMLMTTESGEQKLASFIDEQRMCRLYEKFILEYYRKEFPEISSNASQIPWQLDDDSNDLLPVMQSDIMLSEHERIFMTQIRMRTESSEPRFITASEWVASPNFKSSYLPMAIELLEKINNDPELLEWCKKYSVYDKSDERFELNEEIDWFFHATYAEGLVVTDYQKYLNDLRVGNYVIVEADNAWLRETSLCQLLSVLAYHFRLDYHCNGSLISESIASGAMLRIIDELNRRFAS